MAKYKNTTEWKHETGQRSINIFMPIPLLFELDSMKGVAGSSRSEMIRTAIRLYLKMKKGQLAEEELKELRLNSLKKQQRTMDVNTGLLPDY